MDNLRDICLKNCSITKMGLKHLNWTRLENINIMGARVDGIPCSIVTIWRNN